MTPARSENDVRRHSRKAVYAAEAAALADVQTDSLGDDDRGQNISAIIATVKEQIPQSLTLTWSWHERVF